MTHEVATRDLKPGSVWLDELYTLSWLLLSATPNDGGFTLRWMCLLAETYAAGHVLTFESPSAACWQVFELR